jgi:hypothetical protein|tara:strand:+ start:312 stop:713 length:402 start_codon:yes stop_codon:yes gene_type:complete
MKITKQTLKSLVKECLMEILTEGIGGKKARLKSRNATQKRIPRRPAPDLVHFNNTVNETVNNLTDDPLMASIFANTAKTTLQEQISMEGPGHGSQMGGFNSSNVGEKIGDPSEIFESAAGNWAELAFSEKKIR